MKFIFLSGGFAGFLIAASTSYWLGHEADRVLFDAAIGCLAGALLFRWFISRRYRHATAEGASLAQVLQGIAAHDVLARLAGGSLWWPMGGAGGEGDHDPTITIAQGLPQPDQFAELLACGW